MFRIIDLSEKIENSVRLGNANTECKGISIDSRTINAGELFFALRGERYDGHQFIKSACENGAAGVVLEKAFYKNNPLLFDQCKKPFLLVDNSLLALQKWAQHIYSQMNPLAICITGSNGKTTTKELIAHLLKSDYQVLKSRGNYNNEIGVPLTVFDLKKNHNVLVIEMAAQRRGEIKELTGIVQPDMAIITNIGEAHIGLFGSRENIAWEKWKLVAALENDGIAFLNHDDSYFNDFCRGVPDKKVISFGFHPKAQVRAINIKEENEKGMYFDLGLPDGHVYPAFIPLIGKFNIYNALAAIAVAMQMNINIDRIIQEITTFNPLPLHMNINMLARGIMLIEDCYNANPTSTKEALYSVATISGKRFKVAILGDMLELGKQAADYHREIGRLAGRLSFDSLILLGEYRQHIAEGASESGVDKGQVYLFNLKDKKKLANDLFRLIPDNSIVLLKGSRNMQLEEVIKYWAAEEKKVRNHHV